jgi:hypothetical protein
MLLHFHCHDLDPQRAYITMMHYYPITTNSEPCLIRVVVLWSIHNHRLSVSDVPPPVEWYFVVPDEDNGVCTFCSRHTLGKSSELLSVHFAP